MDPSAQACFRVPLVAAVLFVGISVHPNAALSQTDDELGIDCTDNAAPGDDNCQVKVKNNGTETKGEDVDGDKNDGLQIADGTAMLTGADFTSVTPSQGTCSVLQKSFTCDLLTLNPGGVATVALKFVANSPVTLTVHLVVTNLTTGQTTNLTASKHINVSSASPTPTATQTPSPTATPTTTQTATASVSPTPSPTRTPTPTVAPTTPAPSPTAATTAASPSVPKPPATGGGTAQASAGLPFPSTPPPRYSYSRRSCSSRFVVVGADRWVEVPWRPVNVCPGPLRDLDKIWRAL